MAAILYFVAILAALSAGLGFFELLSANRPGATVFQQISARVDVGLSLLVFVTSLGLGGILQKLSIGEKEKPEPTGLKIEQFRGTDIFKRGKLYRAAVNGEWRESESISALKADIDRTLGA